MKWIDKLPLWPLIIVAVFFAIVPLGASHLAEKIHMLIDGSLYRPIDIFDLFMHSTPAAILFIRLGRMMRRK